MFYAKENIHKTYTFPSNESQLNSTSFKGQTYSYFAATVISDLSKVGPMKRTLYIIYTTLYA